MGQNDFELRSKQLAYILRHSKDICRIYGGWVSISEVLQRTRLSFDMISEIVSKDRKGRFEINAEAGLIRALYGHSVSVEMGYKEVEPPAILLHGTDKYSVDRIMQEGLNPRSRQYVHLTDDLVMAEDTGHRHGDASVMNVDVATMHRDGFKFYNPVPHIWLVSSVPAKYIKPFGDICEEIDIHMLDQKPICVIDLNRNKIDGSVLGEMEKFCDIYHISEYTVNNGHQLTIVFVNEYDDWKKYRDKIEKIKKDSGDFIMFYTYELAECLDIDIPYISTMEYPHVILKSLYNVLSGDSPVPINYADLVTFLSSGDKNWKFHRYESYGNFSEIVPGYVRELADPCQTRMLLHIAIPATSQDMEKISDCISKSICLIPEQVEVVWGCSFAKEYPLSIVAFVK